MAASEQRKHSRKPQKVKVRVFKKGKDNFDFSAHIRTVDVSSGGAFLESTFFLKKGIEVELELAWPELRQPICAAAEVVRVVDHPRSGQPSGFAVRFVRFHDKSDVLLRMQLTRGDLLRFVEKFVRDQMKNKATSDPELLAELVIRWEMHQETLPD